MLFNISVTIHYNPVSNIIAQVTDKESVMHRKDQKEKSTFRINLKGSKKH